jgi:HSP20 family molecular chaperone IbpA
MNQRANVQQKDRVEQAPAEATRNGLQFVPRVDICETEQELTLYADLPGVAAGDVDLHYEQGELLLRGRVRPRQGERTFLLQEYGEGDFYRLFRINETIDSSKITAECKNGVLTVHLPKAEQVRPRQITVAGPRGGGSRR